MFKTFQIWRNMAKRIGTHNGTFHCDEVFACFMLKQLPEFKDAQIVRSRDPKILDECDVVLDVGGVFDPQRFRFDHHQKSFEHSFHSLVPSMRFTTKLSTAGLVYVHYGKKIIRHLLNDTQKNDDAFVELAYEKLYEQFVEAIDAIDNGIEQRDGTPRYAITTTIGSRVAHLNPWWNSENKDETPRFFEAMELVGREFLDRFNFLHKCWWPARDLVKSAIDRRFEVDSSGEIIVMDQGGCPWKEHLFAIENELNNTGTAVCIKYVLYTDETNKNWRIQSVPVGPHTFESRLPLPAAWRSLRDEELSKVVGLDGCIFCHTSGFIGGHATRQGVLTMARKALEIAKNAKAGEV